MLGGDHFGDGDENLNGQQTDAILVVLDQVLEQGYHFLHNNRSRHLLNKLGEVGGGLTAHHGGLIVNEQSELLAELLLDGRRDLLVGSSVQSTSRYLGGEPVGFGQSDCQGNEVFFDLLGGKVFADLVE